MVTKLERVGSRLVDDHVRELVDLGVGVRQQTDQTFAMRFPFGTNGGTTWMSLTLHAELPVRIQSSKDHDAEGRVVRS